jgi:hypothetical protein
MGAFMKDKVYDRHSTVRGGILFILALILVLVGCDMNPREKAKAPAADPYPGSYQNAVYLTLTSVTSDAEIRYTLNETDPGPQNGALYKDPFILKNTAIVKAVAFRKDLDASEVVALAYTITSLTPPVVPTDSPTPTPTGTGSQIESSIAPTEPVFTPTGPVPLPTPSPTSPAPTSTKQVPTPTSVPTIPVGTPTDQAPAPTQPVPDPTPTANPSVPIDPQPTATNQAPTPTQPVLYPTPTASNTLSVLPPTPTQPVPHSTPTATRQVPTPTASMTPTRATVPTQHPKKEQA